MLVNPKCFNLHRKFYDGCFETGLNPDFFLWGRNDFDRTSCYGKPGFDPKKKDSILTDWANHDPGWNYYGVADTPDQIKEKFGEAIQSDPRPFVICVTHIKKDPENVGRGGGWRWHKWGEYIGTGTPTCEYLDDEEDFPNGVFVFSIILVDNVEYE